MLSVYNNSEKYCHYFLLVLVLERLTSVRCAYVRASGDSIASASATSTASQCWAIVVSLPLSRRCLELPLLVH